MYKDHFLSLFYGPNGSHLGCESVRKKRICILLYSLATPNPTTVLMYELSDKQTERQTDNQPSVPLVGLCALKPQKCQCRFLFFGCMGFQREFLAKASIYLDQNRSHLPRPAPALPTTPTQLKPTKNKTTGTPVIPG